MPSRFSLFLAAAAFASSSQLLTAQYTISVHSGLIQYTNGAVTAGGQPIRKTTTNVLELKKGDVLATGADGMAEVLMTPGVFVRMVGNSSLRLDSNSLADTRVTVLTGSVMVECAELIKGDNVTFFVSAVPGSPAIELRKPGLFRIDAQPARVAVLHGEVFAAGLTVTKDRMLALGLPVLQTAKYIPNKQDDLYLFSEARAADNAYASNVVSQSAYSAGTTCMNSSWYYMSPVGMYAYLPCGSYNNYFGYPYYGVNFGYMYGGLPYYYPPPNLVVPIGGGGPTTVVPKPLPHHQSPVVTADHTVAVASNGGLMKVPAFTSVLKTKPTYMTVSRATYTANIQPASLKSSGSSRIEANRFMVATSLPASHAGVSGHSSGAAYRVEASYGAGGSSSHYSGGSSYVGGGYSGGSASHVSAVASSSVSTTASHK